MFILFSTNSHFPTLFTFPSISLILRHSMMGIGLVCNSLSTKFYDETVWQKACTLLLSYLVGIFVTAVTVEQVMRANPVDLAFDETIAVAAAALVAAAAVAAAASDADALVDLLGNCLRQPMFEPIAHLSSLADSPVSLKSFALKCLVCHK